MSDDKINVVELKKRKPNCTKVNFAEMQRIITADLLAERALWENDKKTRTIKVLHTQK